MGHTRCRALLGQAQNSARARVAHGTPNPLPHPPRPSVTARVDCGVVGGNVATFFNGKCGASPTSPLKAEEAGAVTLLRLHCFFHLQKFPSALRLHTSSAVSRICGAAGLLVPLPSPPPPWP